MQQNGRSIVNSVKYDWQTYITSQTIQLSIFCRNHKNTHQHCAGNKIRWVGRKKTIRRDARHPRCRYVGGTYDWRVRHAADRGRYAWQTAATTARDECSTCGVSGSSSSPSIASL